MLVSLRLRKTSNQSRVEAFAEFRKFLRNARRSGWRRRGCAYPSRMPDENEAATLRHYIGLRQTREVPPERAQKLREHSRRAPKGRFIAQIQAGVGKSGDAVEDHNRPGQISEPVPARPGVRPYSTHGWRFRRAAESASASANSRSSMPMSATRRATFQSRIGHRGATIWPHRRFKFPSPW